MKDIYQQIYEFVSNHNISHVSLDIFDTLVFRNTHFPNELFSNILPLNQDIYHSLSDVEFKTLREQAEISARNGEKQHEDITLEQIYAQLPISLELQTALIQHELKAEKHNAVLNLKLIRLIEDLLTLNVCIVLISDMYLSVKQIRDTFFNFETLVELPLFVSSECHVTKQSGKLFGYVAERMSIDKSRWLHVGDNLDADVRSAQASGIHAIHFNSQLNFWRIRDAEKRLFQVNYMPSAPRLLAALDVDSTCNEYERTAYELGAIVWGPILAAFSDWAIKVAIRNHCTHIVCLMREGYVFNPVLMQRLKQIGHIDVKIVSLYVSRKSALWPAVDLEQYDWLEKLMIQMMAYRGYSLENFVRDFNCSEQLLSQLDPKLKLQNIEGIFVDGQSLFSRLVREAKDAQALTEKYVCEQKQYFKQYFAQTVSAPIGQCAVVDFGDGGTIQHYMEQALGQKSGANLLFYSSARIYRFISSTLYHAFLANAEYDFKLAEYLARSPECIEALLLGSEGSTLRYVQNGEQITALKAPAINTNQKFCEQFLCGVLAYLQYLNPAHQSVRQVDAKAVLARYLFLPTQREAWLFCQLIHQDNFGTDGEYPIISAEQLGRVEVQGLDTVYRQTKIDSQWQKGEIPWPAAVISVLDDRALEREYGLVRNDNYTAARELVKNIVSLSLKHVTAYGAGEFFCQISPLLKQNGIEIDFLVDRRAEVNGSYRLDGVSVITLSEALDRGCTNFIVCSYAFKTEITTTIHNLASAKGTNWVRVITC